MGWRLQGPTTMPGRRRPEVKRTHTTAYPWYGVCAPCHNEVGAFLAPTRSSFIGYNVSPEGGVVRPATHVGSVMPAIAEYSKLGGVQPPIR